MSETKTSKMTVTLPSDREIQMTWVFDAPKELVFEAHTKPEHLRKWWGSRDDTMVVCDMDLRVGGTYRFVLRSAGGEAWAFRGEFREISPPDRIVQTFEYEGMPGKISIETLEFEERGGRTTLTNTSLLDSKEDRDNMLASGMEEGATESMERLEKLLPALRT